MQWAESGGQSSSENQTSAVLCGTDQGFACQWRGGAAGRGSPAASVVGVVTDVAKTGSNLFNLIGRILHLLALLLHPLFKIVLQLLADHLALFISRSLELLLQLLLLFNERLPRRLKTPGQVLDFLRRRRLPRHCGPLRARRKVWTLRRSRGSNHRRALDNGRLGWRGTRAVLRSGNDRKQRHQHAACDAWSEKLFHISYFPPRLPVGLFDPRPRITFF